MSEPISPRPVRAWRPEFLPAYVGNGLMGLRVPRVPFADGVAILGGFAGVHPTDHVEGFAQAPYPLAGNVGVGEATVADHMEGVTLVEQAYDFSCGELSTRLRFHAGEARAEIDVLTFCSRTHPTVAAQEIVVSVDRACDVTLRAAVDPVGIPGTWDNRKVDPAKAVDGSMRWKSHGALATCGAAYATELLGSVDAKRAPAGGELERLATTYSFRARAGRRYRLRQLTSLVTDALHREPDRQAIRLAYAGMDVGFDELRAENRQAWTELWRARVNLVGAPRRWQAMADAAFFYLHTSAHSSSTFSTSMFGLSYWPDYHYYRGHVMWDIEAFALPPLVLTEPAAARALLDFRADRLSGALDNAAMAGFRGAQFPWESGLRFGHEAAPDEGSASGVEHHVSLDVAHAFIRFVHATGDVEYARTCAWPVVRAVCEWIESRVTETRRGYEIQRVLGVAEKEGPENNSAFTNLGAIYVLREALALAELVGTVPGRRWAEIARRLVVPLDRRSGLIRNYDGHRASDEKGTTPDAAAALLLFGHDAPRRVVEATFRRAVELADGYVGSPMLSPLLGVFAARLGDRERALELFERGYADFVLEPYAVTDEYSPDVFPDRTRAGPFTANLGAFLLACLYGLSGLRLGPGPPETWCELEPLFPTGWRGIEVERIWARDRPARLAARHGDERASIELD
jgi:protein-glucosylgalactosylhydroxylysine glucosidase